MDGEEFARATMGQLDVKRDGLVAGFERLQARHAAVLNLADTADELAAAEEYLDARTDTFGTYRARLADKAYELRREQEKADKATADMTRESKVQKFSGSYAGWPTFKSRFLSEVDARQIREST